MMIIIVFKGAIRDCLQTPHCAANRLQHVHSSGPGAIVCKSRATHRALITCNMTWQSLNRIYLSFILLTEPLTDEGGEEARVPGRNTLTTILRKCHILKPEDSSPKRDSSPHNSIGGRLGKQACKPLHHASPQRVSLPFDFLM